MSIDDFAKKKGYEYGLIITDLITHKTLDVLPDRESETVTAWLKEHPQIKVVSRDGSNAFREGISNANPSITQISDRFHYMDNFFGYLHNYVKNTFPSFLFWNVDRETVLMKLATELQGPSTKKRKRRKKPVDQFEGWMLDKILDGTSVKNMFELLKKQGYTGTISAVRIKVEDLHRVLKELGKQTGNIISNKDLRSLLWKESQKLKPEEKETLNECFLVNPKLFNLYTICQEFRESISERNFQKLLAWLRKIQQNSKNVFHSFAKGMMVDIEAIRNSFLFSFSNGPTEGKICKLKLIKREMFGRASISLLKNKMCLADHLLF